MEPMTAQKLFGLVSDLIRAFNTAQGSTVRKLIMEIRMDGRGYRGMIELGDPEPIEELLFEKQNG